MKLSTLLSISFYGLLAVTVYTLYFIFIGSGNHLIVSDTPSFEREVMTDTLQYMIIDDYNSYGATVIVQ